MNKAELVESVIERCAEGHAFPSKVAATEAVNAVFDVISEQLEAGERVGISDFGSFVVKDRAARRARNVQNGEIIEVPATRAVKFTASQKLKAAVK